MEPRHKIGEELICINVEPFSGNSIAPPLNENDHYPLRKITTCRCGEHHYDVGLRLEVNWVSCHKCREELPQEAGAETHWAHHSRFE